MQKAGATWKSFAISVVALWAWIAVWATFVLGTPFHWWFEDDPAVYAFVAKVSEPLRFLYSGELIRSYQLTELVPVLHMSAWLDQALAPLSPTAAYIHSVVSLAIAATALMIVLRRLLERPAVALGAAVLWTMLPATIAAHEFLSARCYIEGLAFSCFALSLAVGRPEQRDEAPTVAALVMMTLLQAAAMVSKEFYPPTLLTLVFLAGVWRRRPAISATSVAVAVAYLAYRVSMLGFSASYGMPFISRHRFLIVVSHLPYMVAGSDFGFLIAAVASLLALLAVRRGDQKTRAIITGAGIALVLAILTLYPIGAALWEQWSSHGTWARSSFMVSTLVLAIGAIGVAALPVAWTRWAVGIGCAAILMLGSWRTYTTWDAMTLQNARFGRFFLEHPERLLYSTLPAPWFLPGLRALYQDAQVAAVIEEHEAKTSGCLRSRIEPFDVIWHDDGHEFLPDPALRAELLGKCDTVHATNVSAHP